MGPGRYSSSRGYNSNQGRRGHAVVDLGWFLGFQFGLDLLLLLIGPTFRPKELRKLLTLACLRNNLSQKLIDRKAKMFLSKMLENGCGFSQIVGVASKFSNTLLDSNPPLHEIMYLPPTWTWQVYPIPAFYNGMLIFQTSFATYKVCTWDPTKTLLTSSLN